MEKYFIRDPENMWKWKEVTEEVAFSMVGIRGFEEDEVIPGYYYAIYDDDYRI